jgi:MerR family transcriptional regulator, repressor of the yfmOP operon
MRPEPKTTGAEARLVSIGEAAESLGVTTRTLRYYEELGLVRSSRSSLGSQRRYGPDEIARLRQVRELQTLLGLELDEIGEYLDAFDRLDALREEYRSGPRPERREAILGEGMAILDRLQARVRERQAGLEVFAAELQARADRYRAAEQAAVLPHA